MSLGNSMSAGLSALSAMSRSIAQTSDNIANVNTVGHRGSRAVFEDALTQSLFGIGELGTGVQLARIQKLFDQGAIIPTGLSTDMAINGRGFFVVNGTVNGVTGDFYSRAGNFVTDSQGYLVRPGNPGLRLQGYQADRDGNLSGQVGDLQFQQGTVPPRATEDIGITAQLPSDAADLSAAPPFDPNDEATWNESTSVTVYDSLGEARELRVFFRNEGGGNWSWYAVADGDDLNPQTGVPTVVANGGLTFDTEGRLQTQTTVANTVDFLNATPGQVLGFDFGEAIADGGDGSGTSQYADPFSVAGVFQDGFSTGEFASLDISIEGEVTARYTNGQVFTVGRVAVGSFLNEDGLRRIGGTLFQETLDSGQAAVGFANSGGRGEVIGGALEQSNVDLSEEFVRLINDQRAFQAAGRTITTADELLSETINLKR